MMAMPKRKSKFNKTILVRRMWWGERIKKNSAIPWLIYEAKPQQNIQLTFPPIPRVGGDETK